MNITDILPTAARPYAKAVITLVVVFLGAVQLVLDGGITTSEWIEVIITTLIATGAAYGARNDPA